MANCSGARSKRAHKVFLTSVTHDDMNLKINKLPTYTEVLKCRLAYNIHGKLVPKDANKKVIEKLKNIYEFAAIPTITDQGMEKMIINYYNQYRKFEKYPEKQCKSESFLRQIDVFREDGNKLMDFSGDISKCLPQDIEFLQNMRSSRTMVMGSLDVTAARCAKLAMEKESAEMKRRQKEEERVKNLMIIQNISEDCDEGVQYDTEYTFKQNSSRRKSMFQGCNIHIPSDILANRNLVSSMTRMGITHTQACVFLETLISECGGNPRDIHLSYNYSHRHREKAVHDTSISIKENFEGKFPLGLHWDGKTMDDIEDNNVKIERLAVIVSDLEGKTKFLGGPKVPIGAEPGTAGKHIAEATIKLLKEWKIQDLVATMIFDTTATNTGVHTGACKRIQELFERPLLWCACRKHIGEIHITHCFDVLKIEGSKSPDIIMYNTFQDNFHLISIETQKKTFNINEIDPQHREFFLNQKAIIITTFNELKAKDAYPRDDYKELMNLVLMYIGENDNYIIHKPGATHKARWLMKLLHSIKIVLLEDGIPKDIFGKGRSGAAKMEKMKRFVNFFCILLYPMVV